MVPYINFPYAEHILKQMGKDPNIKATIDDIDILIEASKKCQDLARSLEKQESIKGYIVYEEDKKKEDSKKD